MDPFADKVLVLGAFVMLAGPAFSLYQGWSMLGVAGSRPSLSRVQVSGVEPWMVVVMLARELLVTTIRAVLESRGIDFSASLSGKLKMIAQSIGVPLILLLCILAEPDLRAWVSSSGGELPGSAEVAILANRIVAWTLTVITAWSALPYIVRAINALREPVGATP
jgi:phosphatidylglycerophosphate synthase